MSERRFDGTVVIAVEPEDVCEQCGSVEETRPYGPGGLRICFPCGRKDPEGTKARMAEVLFGDTPSVPS